MKHTKCPANGKKKQLRQEGRKKSPNFGSRYFASGTGIRAGKQLFLVRFGSFGAQNVSFAREVQTRRKSEAKIPH